MAGQPGEGRLGRGAIEYSFTAVCGGCERRQPINAKTPTGALAEIIGQGWGEDPTIGMVCRGCVKKIAANYFKNQTKVTLTDASGAPLHAEGTEGNGDK